MKQHTSVNTDLDGCFSFPWLPCPEASSACVEGRSWMRAAYLSPPPTLLSCSKVN